MDLIILNDGMYHLVPVTKQMMDGIVLTSEINCFDLCDILRLHLTMYTETLNAHVMNDGSGDFFGCICK
jgi:NADP-dependent 3-hydroxy acid dehydrogenase YdfG